MRTFTPLGWQRLYQGFAGSLPPLRDEAAFWDWAMEQGSAFRLAAYLLVGMLGGGESDFPGFDEVRADSHPVRLAWALDDTRRALIADFLLNPRTYMR